MERSDFELWKGKEVARLLALLETGRRYYRDIVAALPVAVVVLSADRSIVFANRAFRQAFNLRAEDAGRVALDQVLPSEGLIERIRDVHVHGIAQPGVVVEVSGKRLSIAIVPIRNWDEEQEPETLLVVQEANSAGAIASQGPAEPQGAPLPQVEQRQLTAARNSALQGLAGRLAHDLNNPLMIVTGYAEELLQGLKADDPQRANAAQILEAAQRIAALTTQLLEFTRKYAKPAQPVELAGVLAGLVNGGVALDSRASQPVWAMADAGQLGEILAVLARAACQGAADPRAAIGCDMVEQPSACARITISGNGRALDARQQAAIFETVLAKDPQPGAGPALARAYSTVREWGGDVTVGSQPSGGVVFAVYLPLATPQKTRPRAQSAQRPRETVLVVDDEANIRTLVAKILRREGYQVLEAGNAREAFAAAATHGGPVHLLVTDVMLPGEGGRQIAERMRQAMPNLKVLFISGFSGEEFARAGDFPPGSKYLQKPFALGALLSAVHDALEA